MVHEVGIPDDCSSSVMLQAIRKELQMLDPNIVLKVRSLVVLACLLREASGT